MRFDTYNTFYYTMYFEEIKYCYIYVNCFPFQIVPYHYFKLGYCIRSMLNTITLVVISNSAYYQNSLIKYRRQWWWICLWELNGKCYQSFKSLHFQCQWVSWVKHWLTVKIEYEKSIWRAQNFKNVMSEGEVKGKLNIR